MTEVFFYILDDSDAQARFRLAWRVAERAARAGRQIYVHTDDAVQAARLDDDFWRLPSTGFLPHERTDAGGQAPVMIGFGDNPGEHHDVLLNLAGEVPDFFSRFARVAELVTGDENERKDARARWKFYRDRGFPVQDHRLKQ